ncbi:hypothetical protein [Microviridae sp.]|nr:hypothetical protein [Microviridae sp.]
MEKRKTKAVSGKTKSKKQKWHFRVENYIPDKGETNNKPSMTVPDMHLTIQELLLSHTRGVEPNVKYYDENAYFEGEIPVFDDIAEVYEFRENLKTQINALDEQIKLEVTQGMKKQLQEQKTALKNQSEAIESSPQEPRPGGLIQE